MQTIKVGWVGQAFALAKLNDCQGKKRRSRCSKEERRTKIEFFIKKYQKLNSGNFPSLSLTHKEVGGSFYTVREIVREIIQENRTLTSSTLSPQVVTMDDCHEEQAFGSLSLDPDLHNLSSDIDLQSLEKMQASTSEGPFCRSISNEQFSGNSYQIIHSLDEQTLTSQTDNILIPQTIDSLSPEYETTVDFKCDEHWQNVLVETNAQKESHSEEIVSYLNDGTQMESKTIFPNDIKMGKRSSYAVNHFISTTLDSQQSTHSDAPKVSPIPSDVSFNEEKLSSVASMSQSMSIADVKEEENFIADYVDLNNQLFFPVSEEEPRVNGEEKLEMIMSSVIEDEVKIKDKSYEDDIVDLNRHPSVTEVRINDKKEGKINSSLVGNDVDWNRKLSSLVSEDNEAQVGEKLEKSPSSILKERENIEIKMKAGANLLSSDMVSSTQTSIIKERTKVEREQERLEGRPNVPEEMKVQSNFVAEKDKNSSSNKTGKSSKKSEDLELNPIVAIIKSLVEAFVKFWTED